MEIARVQLARAIWLFDTGDLNPQGAQVFPDLIFKVIERYGFRKFPKAEEFFEVGKARRFEDGSFLYDGRKVTVTAEFWGDGLIADTQHSTHASDAFLADLIEWMGEYLGVKYRANMTRKRGYRSELIVVADEGLSRACAFLDAFAGVLGEVTGESAEPSGLIYSSDQKRGFFTIDRRLNEPFENNKFYTAAMVQTGTHTQLLGKLDQLLNEARSVSV